MNLTISQNGCFKTSLVGFTSSNQRPIIDLMGLKGNDCRTDAYWTVEALICFKHNQKSLFFLSVLNITNT